MSQVNIRRLVAENIRATTTVYAPLVEAVFNAVQAIEEHGRADGQVTIRLHRSSQKAIDNSKPDIESIDVIDNGVGFTQTHRDSFDTLFSGQKEFKGGKGFGRFICLKYFEDVVIDSTFSEADSMSCRTFEMGKEDKFIVNEVVAKSDALSSGTCVSLRSIKEGNHFDKLLGTVADNLLERILPIFFDETAAPIIRLEEADGSASVILNNLIESKSDPKVMELGETKYWPLGPSNDEQVISTRVFRIYSPENRVSKISLVAHGREVVDTPLKALVPEFEEGFRDEKDRNYIVRVYAFGTYLDSHVLVERSGFAFSDMDELWHPVSRRMIEEKASQHAREAVGIEIIKRSEAKQRDLREFADEYPWHRDYLSDVDTDSLPMRPTPEQMEMALQKARFNHDQATVHLIRTLHDPANPSPPGDQVEEIVSRITESNRSDLCRYVVMRKTIIDLLRSSLELKADEKYEMEKALHAIVFPLGKDSDAIAFDDHNLWLVDERLSFCPFVSSDMANLLDSKNRSDVAIFHKPIVCSEDITASNPITIVEFKRPGRDDFASSTSKDNPVQQVVNYVTEIRDGKFSTPQGRPVTIDKNTPFFGYIICDINGKVEKWLYDNENFKPTPDGKGWYDYKDNINLYLEVLSWDKVVRDAELRHRAFFRKLGINTP